MLCLYNSLQLHYHPNILPINQHHYPVEYLNSISKCGIFPTQLRLKAGIPLMLLQNQNLSCGLCSGTRLCLVHMTNRVLNVRIISGPFAGETCIYPWNKNFNYPRQLPFELHQQQFPVGAAFTMMINRSQGQSLGAVGIDFCIIQCFLMVSFMLEYQAQQIGAGFMFFSGRRQQIKQLNIVYKILLSGGWL